MRRYMVVGMLNGAGIVVDTRDTTPRELSVQEIVDRLNATPPAAPGIVWRKAGDPGLVDGHNYLVAYNGHHCVFEWSSGYSHEGWSVPGVTHWSEIPPIPEDVK